MSDTILTIKKETVSYPETVKNEIRAWRAKKSEILATVGTRENALVRYNTIDGIEDKDIMERDKMNRTYWGCVNALDGQLEELFDALESTIKEIHDLNAALYRKNKEIAELKAC